MALSASTENMARRMFASIERPELADDPRFRTNSDRLRHSDEFDALIGPIIAQKTQEENVAFFERAEVTIGPVYDISQIIEDPHVIERELLTDYPDPDMDSLPMHHPGARFLRTPASIRTPAPSLGEHNRQLLSEVGVGEAAYRELLASGVAVEGEPQKQPVHSERSREAVQE